MPLLTYDEYSKIEHSTPYLLQIVTEGKYLFFFGEKHSFDPENAQWDKLKEFWSEFLNSTTGKDRIVLTEGGIRPLAASEREAITNYGGMGLVTFLAHQSGIKVSTPEPNAAEERAELERAFNRDEIQYYYFARVVAQYGRLQNPKPKFEEYITNYLNRDQQESKWDKYDFSLDHMKELHANFSNTEFEPYDYDYSYEISKPTGTTTKTNMVARMVGEIRDKHIVEEIKKYWDAGNSIFATYGSSHVVIQEPLLKELLT